MGTPGNLESNLFGLLGQGRSTGYRHPGPKPLCFRRSCWALEAGVNILTFGLVRVRAFPYFVFRRDLGEL